MMNEAFVKSGPVQKKSPKGWSGAHIWQKRWLVLSKETLYYFKEKTSKDAQGTIPVNKITGVYRVPSKKSPARFDVCHNNRAYAFKCETSEEASKWVDAIFNLLPAQQKLKAKADEAKLAKAAEMEEDGRKSVIGGVGKDDDGGDEDDGDVTPPSPLNTAAGAATPKSTASGGLLSPKPVVIDTPKKSLSGASTTPSTTSQSGSGSGSASATPGTPKLSIDSKVPIGSKDAKSGSIGSISEDEVKLDNDEKRDAGSVTIRVRCHTGAKVLMYASPNMRCGTIKEKIWGKKAFAKDKMADYAIKLFNGDILFDDTQPFARVQYLSWVFAETSAQSYAALPQSAPTPSAAVGTVLDLYLIPRADFADVKAAARAAAGGNSVAAGSTAAAALAAASKLKPSTYGVVTREGAATQFVSGSWKDRYVVLQDDVLFFFETKAAWQSRSAPSLAIPMGSVKSRSEDPAPGTAPPTPKKDSRPNTIELSGGVLKMDLVRFSCDSKGSVEDWLALFHNVHLRLAKLIVVSCAEELEARGLGMEGIFRLSGSQDEVLKLKDDFEARLFPSLKRADDHALTGVFKMCLRKMYNPLIPFKAYDEFIHTADLEAKSDHAATLRVLIPKLLPISNHNVFQYTMAFLYRVSTFAETNKMKPANLSIVIAPNILRPREETMQSTVGDAGNQLKTVAVCIEKHADLWGKVITGVYDKYITQLIKHQSGDTKVDAADLIAWQKDYTVGSSGFIKSIATSDLSAAWASVFAALEKHEHNITQEMHTKITNAIADEEAWRAATLDRLKQLTATLYDLAPNIKAAPAPVTVAATSASSSSSSSSSSAASGAAAAPKSAAAPSSAAKDDDEPAPPPPAADPASPKASGTASTTAAAANAGSKSPAKTPAAAEVPPSPTIGGAGGVEYCVALYDYASTDVGEVSFKEADRILITDRSDDWWKGKVLSTGAAGQFPSNYVQLETVAP